MSFERKQGNNHVYLSQLTSLDVGKYEFTAYCIDDDDDKTWRSGPNGRAEILRLPFLSFFPLFTDWD